jgi:hypothetical protein
MKSFRGLEARNLVTRTVALAGMLDSFTDGHMIKSLD